MNFVLVGNPNAGKTTIFNALTGSHEKTGNWHGITVEEKARRVKWGNQQVTLIDLPGLYSLQCYSMEECSAKQVLFRHKNDLIVNVIEASALSRSLNLTRELIQSGYRVVVVITMLSFLHGFLDLKQLSDFLQLPVFSADVIQKGSDGLKEFLLSNQEVKEKTDLAISLPTKIFHLDTYRESRMEKMFFHPILWLPLFLFMMTVAFYCTFAKTSPGYWMKSAVEWIVIEKGGDLIRVLCSSFPLPLQGLFLNGIVQGVGSVLSFVPQIGLLYLFLILMEESGYFSILAFMSDGIFQKVGLSGRAVFSLLMGLGCTSAAILTTKACSCKAEQREIISCLPYIPCSAKLPILLTLSSSFFSNPFLIVLILYFLSILLSLFIVFLQRKKTSTPLINEIANLRIPNGKVVWKSLSFYLKGYIIKTATVILAFLILSWFLSSFNQKMQYVSVEQSMLGGFCQRLQFLFLPMGIRDWQTAYAALSGLIAKENVSGILRIFYGTHLPFTFASATSFTVFLLTCSPCVSAISSSLHEIGMKRTLVFFLLQTVSSFLAAYFTYACTQHIWMLLLIPVIGLVIYFEKLYSGKRNKFKAVYRR